ncbi:hypothetical protein [Candidatus Korarchaeum cryptofilum]|jgi:hypothetical protein|uniref:hypothetical protein n=1 Tax=Candidatus Korarchaeum cryptofilum TaxID=498846 RepID=UPI00163BE834|nr:hypothetical protein [Candidatus Korarchaeum cryptofilum]
MFGEARGVVIVTIVLVGVVVVVVQAVVQFHAHLVGGVVSRGVKNKRSERFF